ncbi:hypothetical protein AAFF_G00339750 [Aldrovandia affinis]|uniref:ZP domain-containing protein n=1 Tax=Aldrovandia affinis TaxID=143900 RepID=A0AAD7WP74_9TELE|nr:hypothetical protein AAFF_G00339750 [Aldrovandia affinis]
MQKEGERREERELKEGSSSPAAQRCADEPRSGKSERLRGANDDAETHCAQMGDELTGREENDGGAQHGATDAVCPKRWILTEAKVKMLWRKRLTLLCLLLLGAGTAECGVGVQCPPCPVGALYPVQGFLERFKAGAGCAARERGEKETHVISVGRSSPGSKKQVTVLLRPLSFSRPPSRLLTLVLSSQRAVHWSLESENLPPGLSVLAQVAPPSTVQSRGVELQVRQVSTLPWRPQALLRWSLEQHTNVSSLTHAPLANRVYIRLGEDPTMPSVCQVQPLFLSRNYLTSDLQPQEVRCCLPRSHGNDPEVHIIRLQSAGSGICGSLQVEVPVSVLPPVAGAGWYKVVLILSSAAPVNWALTANGLRGQISVYSSNSVSPLYPPDPDLTLTSMLTPDLLMTHDFLGWANRSGFPKVTSYTEADLANRFVVRLAGGGTDGVVSPRSLAPWPRDTILGEEGWGLRAWLSREGDGAGGTQEAIAVKCQDGQLSVAVDASILQSMSPLVTAVTLRDRGCELQSNGSHFLLVFPVISCGTEGVMEAEPRGVQYKNTVLLWRSRTLPVAVRNETKGGRANRQTPLAIHFSCFTAVPGPPSATRDAPSSKAMDPAGDGAASGAPVFALKLFVTEGFERRESGPCIIMADNRVYVEVSVRGAGGCPFEPTLTLTPEGQRERRRDRGEERKGGKEEEEEEEERDGAAHRLRFSFVLRPVYNNSIQFLHCRLRQCEAGPPGATAQGSCLGRPRLPMLIAQPPSQQCEYRTLLRPILVTQPLALARYLAPSSGQKALKPSTTPLSKPSSADSSSELDTGSVVGISFAAFLIGVTLMGALWCIYRRTGVTLPLRRGSLLEPVDQATTSWTPRFVGTVQQFHVKDLFLLLQEGKKRQMEDGTCVRVCVCMCE